ncbi:MAG: type 2 isopentenyl-diphosphate Delta-isomerase [Marinosulfonomonas sp.]
MTFAHNDRKKDHLRIVLDGTDSRSEITTGLEKIRFEHVALPEIALEDIDLSTNFLGRYVSAPLLVSSMTGGPRRAQAINENIAIACQSLRLPFAVGSQRVALEGENSHGLGHQLRRLAPDVPILGNLGAAQLNTANGVDLAQRAVDMIEADALYIHLNPLQEAVQSGGDRDWAGVLAQISKVVRALPVPLAVKEVGFGLSGPLCRQLADIGVTLLDVAGAGGTNWAKVEAARELDPARARMGRVFADWGIPTAQAIQSAREACPDQTIIGSGGISNGVEVAKALRLGADIVGVAAGILDAAVTSSEATEAYLKMLSDELRVTCFCTGSKDLQALSSAVIRQDRS